MYTKICKDPRCKKEFTTESRNQAYCCPECQKRHFIEKKKRRKTSHSSTYENHIVSRAYALANDIAEIFYPEKVCALCGSESTHVHHIDVNVLNNNPNNLMRVCEACHKKLHSDLPKVNMNSLLRDCRELKNENSQVSLIKVFNSKFAKEDESES